jgi:hypothetical protein
MVLLSEPDHLVQLHRLCAGFNAGDRFTRASKHNRQILLQERGDLVLAPARDFVPCMII